MKTSAAKAALESSMTPGLRWRSLRVCVCVHARARTRRFCMGVEPAAEEPLQPQSKTYLRAIRQRARTRVRTCAAAGAPRRDPREAVDHVS